MPSALSLLAHATKLVAKHASEYYGFAGWLLVPLLFVVGAYATGGHVGFVLLNLANAGFFMLLLWSFAAMMWLTAAHVVYPNRAVDIRHVSAIAWERTFGLATAVFAASILELAGLLLIVPGIIIAVYLTFVAQEAVLHNHPFLHALAASRDLVKGRFWMIFGRVFGLAGLTVTAYVLIGVGIIGLCSALGVFSPTDLLTSPAPLWLEMLLNVIELSLLPIVFTAHTLLYLSLEKR